MWQHGTNLLHLGVDGTGVNGEDVDVVAVGLDNLLGDRSRVEDHGELRATVAIQCGTVSLSCSVKLTRKGGRSAHLGPSVKLDGSQLGVVQLLDRSKVDVAPGHPLPNANQQYPGQLHVG